LVSSKIGANTDMHRRSILRSVACDLKKLPIGALEAFVLSQVHGQSTAEDVAEAVGLELNDLIRVARRLADLGALSVDGEKTKTRRPGPPSTRRTSAPPSPPKAAKPLVPGDLVPVPRKHADLRSLGIVWIPGLMTGMLISGSDPLYAAIYQFVVIAMILASSGLTSLLSTLMIRQHVFSPADQLILKEGV